MKHAAVKVVRARKKLPDLQKKSVKTSQKISDSGAAKPVKDVKLKVEKKTNVSASQNKKLKVKSVESVIDFPKSEIKIVKSASAVSNKKAELKKSASAISAKTKNDGQSLKQQNVSVLKKQEKSVLTTIKNRKSETKNVKSNFSDVRLKNEKQKIVASVSPAKQKPKREKFTPIIAVENQRTEKNAKVLAFEKIETKTAKRNTFISINKIKVIEKKADSAGEKTNQTPEKLDVKSSVSSPEITSIEAEVATKVAPRKSKPKKAKPIGAAVFRGKKGRYDFQVYPLDAEFEDVSSAIYVISKRKTDKQKKAHHALVCIGQTESVLGEIKKHKNKCIKKHHANVISILVEENEKKRLKIEEDLKAAHIIACDFG